MAVRVGFEPTEPVKVQRFSRPPDSTALAPHRVALRSGIAFHCNRRACFVRVASIPTSEFTCFTAESGGGSCGLLVTKLGESLVEGYQYFFDTSPQRTGYIRFCLGID